MRRLSLILAAGLSFSCGKGDAPRPRVVAGLARVSFEAWRLGSPQDDKARAAAPESIERQRRFTLLDYRRVEVQNRLPLGLVLRAEDGAYFFAPDPEDEDSQRLRVSLVTSVLDSQFALERGPSYSTKTVQLAANELTMTDPLENGRQVRVLMRFAPASELPRFCYVEISDDGPGFLFPIRPRNSIDRTVGGVFPVVGVEGKREVGDWACFDSTGELRAR
jgi:hypothetical protein